MSEEKIIKSTAKPNTVDTICQDLIRLGIKNGDVLLVHSSLSSLGWVCGGAQAVIAALLKSVSKDGTIVMPAHSGDLSDPAEWSNPPVPDEWVQIIYDNMPAFEPDTTPARGIGQIAELFRNYPGTKRSNHPQVSFCANGKQAAKIIKEHPLVPQFGMDSPLGKLYKMKAKVLLLGAGYDSCTSFHLAEALIDGMPVKRMGTAIMENGSRIWKWFEDYAYDSDDFNLLGEEFEQSFMVVTGKVGYANCRLFDIKAGVDFAKDWLKKNRFKSNYSVTSCGIG